VLDQSGASFCTAKTFSKNITDINVMLGQLVATCQKTTKNRPSVDVQLEKQGVPQSELILQRSFEYRILTTLPYTLLAESINITAINSNVTTSVDILKIDEGFSSKYRDAGYQVTMKQDFDWVTHQFFDSTLLFSFENVPDIEFPIDLEFKVSELQTLLSTDFISVRLLRQSEQKLSANTDKIYFLIFLLLFLVIITVFVLLLYFANREADKKTQEQQQQ
jgi:hypothetical protein